MCVDARVSSGPCETFILPIRDVNVRSSVAILLRKTKINHVKLIAFPAKADKKVVWFNVPMNEILRMNIFNTTYLETKKRLNRL